MKKKIDHQYHDIFTLLLAHLCYFFLFDGFSHASIEWFRISDTICLSNQFLSSKYVLSQYRFFTIGHVNKSRIKSDSRKSDQYLIQLLRVLINEVLLCIASLLSMIIIRNWCHFYFLIFSSQYITHQWNVQIV